MDDGKPDMNDTVLLTEDDGGQVVRLPEGYRLDAAEVTIRREGDALVLRPVKQKVDEWAWLDGLEPFDDDMVEAALNRPGPDEYDRLDCDLILKD